MPMFYQGGWMEMEETAQNDLYDWYFIHHGKDHKTGICETDYINTEKEVVAWAKSVFNVQHIMTRTQNGLQGAKRMMVILKVQMTLMILSLCAMPNFDALFPPMHASKSCIPTSASMLGIRPPDAIVTFPNS